MKPKKDTKFKISSPRVEAREIAAAAISSAVVLVGWLKQIRLVCI